MYIVKTKTTPMTERELEIADIEFMEYLLRVDARIKAGASEEKAAEEEMRAEVLVN